MGCSGSAFWLVRPFLNANRHMPIEPRRLARAGIERKVEHEVCVWGLDCGLRLRGEFEEGNC